MSLACHGKIFLHVFLIKSNTVAFKFTFKYFTTSNKILFAIKTFKPCSHLGSSLRCFQISVIRIEPVSARIRFLLSEDLHLFTGLKRIGKRNNLTVYLGTDTAMSDVGMNTVCHIKRCRPGRQINNISLRSKQIYTVFKHLGSKFIHQGS